MASAITHAVAACALGYAYGPVGRARDFYALAALCAVAPDLDVIGFHFGIDYGDMLGHRGLSHALSTALVAGVVVAYVALRSVELSRSARARLALFFALVTASHGVLDALTNGGMGVAFFAPFDATRYFFAFRPIEVSPIGIGAFFSAWGARVLANEAVWVGLPCAVIALLAFVLRRARAKTSAR